VNRWSRTGSIVVLAAASLGTVKSTAGRRAYCSFYEFATYYQALAEPKAQAGFWERLTVSIALVSAHDDAPARPAARQSASKPRNM
jgi:hypothetical protein